MWTAGVGPMKREVSVRCALVNYCRSHVRVRFHEKECVCDRERSCSESSGKKDVEVHVCVCVLP